LRRFLFSFWLALAPVGAWASGEDGGTGALEEFTPSEESAPVASPEEFQAAPSAPTVKVSGGARLRVGVDTGFEERRADGLSEQVVNAWGRAALGTDVKLSPTVRLVVEGRALWRGAGLRAGQGPLRADAR
jgi:hypothetical protein